MSDADVAVNFSANVGDLLSGVSQARDALATLSQPAQQLNSQYDDTRESITAAIKIEQDQLRQKLELYSDDAKYYRISEDEKVNLSRAALDVEYADHVALLQREAALYASDSEAKQRVLGLELTAQQRYQDQVAHLTQQSLDAQTREYQQFGDAITGAFNSQLRGLLSGTENWRTAFKNTLEDLLIKFIEWTEKGLVEYLAAEATKTAATEVGVAARVGAEQSGAAASFAAQGATLVRSILSSAAEAFAGVFGFLAPLMGPAAAGPAAGAYGSVAGMAGAVASADIGMWKVPEDMLTLVHRNELIMPSAEAGALRSLLGGAPQSESGSSVVISPTTHFTVQALDGASVSQWMRSNSSAMLKAIDEAVRHGASLGAKRIRFS